MFNAMCEELYHMPFDVIEKIFGDESKIIASCRKAIDAAIHNRLSGAPVYPACRELQDHCMLDDELSPLDLDYDGDDDVDHGYDNDGDVDGDVDFMSRVGIPFHNSSSDDNDDNNTGFTQPVDDDLPF